MEQPPPTAPPPTSTAPSAVVKHGYPDSIDSSPRSRNAESWEDPLPKGGGGAKLRLMCSYGGHIVPRPHDKSLCYVGGDTRIVVADRSSTLSDLTSRLSKTLLGGGSFTLKYQLPNEDLDSLISVTTDEDLENMIDEYDRLAAAANTANPKSSRLRLFLFPTKPDSGSSIGSLLENSTKSEDWFLNALNGSARVFSDSSSVNCLLGLDDAIAGNENSTAKDEPKTLTSSNSNKQQGAQDVHSVPDSPMLENSSSFGSTSSSPSLANLPPIRVHSDDQKPSAGGIEEQLSQMSVGTTVQKQEDGNFLVVASPPPVLTAPPPGVSSVFPGEYTNHLVGFSDDERSDQGMPIGYRKPPQYAQQLPPKTTGGFDLASPDSVSSDNSATNPLSRQRVLVYQDPIVQNSSGNPNLTDPTPRVQVQQVQEAGGYVMQNQFDQTNQQNQQQFNPQQQQQQFIQVPPHYIHHHQAGAIPMPNYYPVYPQHQQQQQQQFPLYYVAARPPQGYNMPIQQQQSYVESAAAPTIVSSRPQTPPPCSVMPPPAAAAAAAQASYSTPVAVPNQETAATVMYRAEGGATARLIQVPSGQQFVGYPQSYHHPSQSVAPPPSAAATATTNYAYEFADPALSQMYYSQHMSQQQPMAAPPQYQTVTSPSAAMVAPETSSQIPTDSSKQQSK